MFGRKQATLIESDKARQVVGTSHYQDALRKVAGKKTKEGVDVATIAALVPHPSNPHDRNAVSVQVDGNIIGYLSADYAANVQPHLQAFRKKTKTHIAVNARITGGWKQSRKDQGNYGARVYFDVADL